MGNWSDNGMLFGQRFQLALRLLRREWKSGTLSVLVTALLVAIISHTAISHFTDRVNRAMMAENANHLLGGDLVLSSSRPFSDEVPGKARKFALQTAEVKRFVTVISAADAFQLTSVKAVGEHYPLKGNVRVTEKLFGPERAVGHGPVPGEIWAEARILQTLQIQLGDNVTLGKTSLKVSKILTYEPDRGNNFYSINARAMMNEIDLARANILQPGSRASYRILFTGEAASVAAMKQWLEQNLQPGQRLRTLKDDQPRVSRALARAERFMGLASLMALLLAAIAIANSGRYYSERHYSTSALLRCFGCRQADILSIYLIQLLLLAAICGLLGNFIGWTSHELILLAVGHLLPSNLPAIGWSPIVSGMALSFVVLIGFTLPSIIRLKSVPPLRVLRQDITTLPIASWLVYGGTALFVFALMWIFTASLALSAILYFGGLVIALLVALLVKGLFYLIAHYLYYLPISLRAGIRNFLKRKREATIQVTAFGLTIMAMLVVVFLRTELVTAWQNTIPDGAPNHFVLNIQSDEVDRFRAFTTENGLNAGPLYPTVRARLTRINDVPVKEIVSKEERGDRILRRDLNLTWSGEIPPDNQVVEGRWWQETDAGQTLVSIESQLAERLSVEVGDELMFFTGDRQWGASVANIREVKWDNFQPNFYIVFNPGSIDHLPGTWINSFHLQSERKSVLTGMIKQFPGITLLEMDSIINQVKSIITQVTLAVESILSFVLIAGFVVTLSAIQTSMDERLREGTLLRTLGAERRLLKLAQWSEFSILGWVSGMIGVIGAEVVNALLYIRVFELPYFPACWAWLWVPICSALLIGMVGIYCSNRVLNQPPVHCLREIGA